MRITESQLRRIIREEAQRLSEAPRRRGAAAEPPDEAEQLYQSSSFKTDTDYIFVDLYEGGDYRAQAERIHYNHGIEDGRVIVYLLKKKDPKIGKKFETVFEALVKEVESGKRKPSIFDDPEVRKNELKRSRPGDAAIRREAERARRR